MVSRIVASLVGLTLLAPFAHGQNAAPDPQISELLRIVKKIDADNGDIKSRLAALEMKVEAVTNLQVEDRAQLHEIAQQDKDGRSYLRLDTSHEPTKLQLRQAMNEVAPTTGELTVRNDTDYGRYISINGETKFVMGRDFIKVSVPVGELRYRIHGEAAQTKYLGYPGYSGEIRLTPKVVRYEWISSTPLYGTYVYGY